jgi:hypothetical protein
MRVVVCYQSLEQLPLIYQDLFSGKSSGLNFFSTWFWYKNFLKTALDDGYDIYLLGVENQDGSNAFALLPMCAKKNNYMLMRFRILNAASNYYTSVFGLISNDQDENRHENIQLLVRFMARKRKLWGSIDLHPLDRDDFQYATFIAAFKENYYSVKEYFCFGNWYLEVGQRNFSSYLEGLSSKLKNTLRKKTKHLESSSGYRIEIATDDENLQERIVEFEQVYGNSWKNSEPNPKFIRGLIRGVAKDGKLRLGLMYVNELPIAAQIWIVHNGAALIYKLAYDRQFSHLSAGTILTAHLMKHVIEYDHVQVIDYLSGDDLYKQDWMAHRKERWGLRAFNTHTLAGKMASMRHIELPNLWLSLKKMFHY